MLGRACTVSQTTGEAGSKTIDGARGFFEKIFSNTLQQVRFPNDRTCWYGSSISHCSVGQASASWDCCLGITRNVGIRMLDESLIRTMVHVMAVIVVIGRFL